MLIINWCFSCVLDKLNVRRKMFMKKKCHNKKVRNKQLRLISNVKSYVTLSNLFKLKFQNKTPMYCLRGNTASKNTPLTTKRFFSVFQFFSFCIQLKNFSYRTTGFQIIAHVVYKQVHGLRNLNIFSQLKDG